MRVVDRHGPGTANQFAERDLRSEQSVDLGSQEIEDAQGVYGHRKVSDARVSGLVAQLSDCVPSVLLLGGDDAVLDQSVHAPLEARPSRLTVFGVGLLVRRPARLLVAVQDRHVGDAP